METPLNASATTAGALMSNSTFVVPLYQREYAWTTDEIDDFWTDLQSGLEDESYFLGLIILTDQDGVKELVDGQQRILTITLLASALRHEAVLSGRKALAEGIRADFLEAIDYSTDEIHPRVILSDAADNETFKKILDPSNPLDQRADYPDDSLSPKLLAARIALSEKLHADLESDPFKRLGLWADYLTNRVYMAVFVHPDSASAFRVFEVINTRGKELTTADLLKNYVLSQSDNSNRADRYQEWQRMSRQFESTGSSALVQFIRHVVSLNAGYVLSRDLFDYIAGRSPSAVKEGRIPPTAEELLVALNYWAPLYLQLMNPMQAGPAESEWLEVFAALDELGVISVRPLLMALSKASRPSEGMRELLRLVVRRIVVGNLGTGNVERRFSETARRINLSGTWEAELRDLMNDLNPTVDEFVDRLRQRSLNKGTLTFLRRSIIQATITPQPLGTLHFIRPRQAADWRDFAEDEFTYWGSTIGNTILAKTTKRPNQTGTWADFKMHLLQMTLDGDSSYCLDEESEFPIDRYSDWTAESVEEQGKKLSVAAARVWYAPDNT